MTKTSRTAPSTFDEAHRAIQRATDPAVLFGDRDFGDRDGDQGSAADAATRRYHVLALLVHPDRVPAARAAEAQAAFARLGMLWERYQRQPATPHRSTVSVGHRIYTVGPELGHGDIADLHYASYLGGDGRNVSVVLKVPRSASANEAMDRESLALRRLAGKKNANHATFAPHLIDSFRVGDVRDDDSRIGSSRHRTADIGTERTANVLESVAGFHSLTKVRTACPDGLDGLDLAWIWRRLLVGLGYAHRAGVVHGAVVPDHILVRPRDQSLVLLDWCYSVVSRGRRPASSASSPQAQAAAVVKKFAELYPPGGPAAHGPNEAADLHMATRCMTSLFRDDVPVPLLRFAQSCLMPAGATVARRPNIWQLVEDFDDLIGQLYGPRRDRPFHRSSVRLDG